MSYYNISFRSLIKITPSNILTALDTFTIGSKVTKHESFWTVLEAAVAKHDFQSDRIPGQAFIPLPEALPFVSAGDGLHTNKCDDYICALHRGQVNLYLKREFAGQAIFCAVVVYTLKAYLLDPEVESEEAEKHQKLEASHVLVAVLASSGPASPLTPGRFVSNKPKNGQVMKSGPSPKKLSSTGTSIRSLQVEQCLE